MKPGRAALLALALIVVCASESQAQLPTPSNCQDFLPLRSAVQKSGNAIKAAIKRKAPPPEICKLFRTFAAATAKMLKFMQTNKSWCGVPDQAIKSAKSNLTQAVKVRTRACQAATAPRPAAPRLSDALGSPPIARPGNTKSGPGTFDTLTGNALAR